MFVSFVLEAEFKKSLGCVSSRFVASKLVTSKSIPFSLSETLDYKKTSSHFFLSYRQLVRISNKVEVFLFSNYLSIRKPQSFDRNFIFSIVALRL